MPDDHSKVAPLLPIPNRTVKRLCADDSADSRVKVGHRQALTAPNTPSVKRPWGFWRYKCEGSRSLHKACKKLDGLQKSDVYCKASLLTRAHRKVVQVGGEGLKEVRLVGKNPEII